MIFTGIEMLFFSLGMLTATSIMGAYYYNRQYRFKAATWLALALGLFLMLFCIAWSVSSVLEGEPRAASMGMLIFGIPSVLLLILARRLALKNVQKDTK
ncbi:MULTISPECIES: hypothetical protein [unclassified Carboxylicivirga]|uniref:hypothetical protein n=1 Tax=Carboxylicivirga TaxID=1628153 RepID=UPI003D32EC72